MGIRQSHLAYRSILMKLRIYRTLWGITREADGEKARSPHLDTEEALAQISKLGYDGVECPLKLILFSGLERFKSWLEKYNLKIIVMIFTDGPVVPGYGIVFGGPYKGFTAPSNPGETDKGLLVETHLNVFKEQVIEAQKLNPTLVNCHSMKDYFTSEMASSFFENALKCRVKLDIVFFMKLIENVFFTLLG